ncbi:MAG: hypothetical protein K9N48_06280 [Verrucomicrobia bacterium]|nr:hypothetical protein [Verrucomicrobiota bacterium]
MSKRKEMPDSGGLPTLLPQPVIRRSPGRMDSTGMRGNWMFSSPEDLQQLSDVGEMFNLESFSGSDTGESAPEYLKRLLPSEAGKSDSGEGEGRSQPFEQGMDASDYTKRFTSPWEGGYDPGNEFNPFVKDGRNSAASSAPRENPWSKSMFSGDAGERTAMNTPGGLNGINGDYGNEIERLRGDTSSLNPMDSRSIALRNIINSASDSTRRSIHPVTGRMSGGVDDSNTREDIFSRLDANSSFLQVPQFDVGIDSGFNKSGSSSFSPAFEPAEKSVEFEPQPAVLKIPTRDFN